MENVNNVLDAIEWLGPSPEAAFTHMKAHRLREWEESSKNENPITDNRKRETSDWHARGWQTSTYRNYKQARVEAERVVRNADADGTPIPAAASSSSSSWQGSRPFQTQSHGKGDRKGSSLRSPTRDGKGKGKEKEKSGRSKSRGPYYRSPSH